MDQKGKSPTRKGRLAAGKWLYQRAHRRHTKSTSGVEIKRDFSNRNRYYQTTEAISTKTGPQAEGLVLNHCIHTNASAIQSNNIQFLRYSRTQRNTQSPTIKITQLETIFIITHPVLARRHSHTLLECLTKNSIRLITYQIRNTRNRIIRLYQHTSR